ncbi:hypothetical protein LBMAG51_08200 [Phycisphaerae bacterium]|nr:hypothetical protein LBMAG51_08200 [Phycisphaerae bacterium]
MLKFFRKNETASRWILIVGMTFLMVSWLVFDKSSSFLTELLIGRATWATTIDGVTVTEGDRARLQQEVRVIGMLGDPTVRALGLEKDPIHWYLLTLEAERAGLVGGAADGQARLAAMAAANKVPERNLIAGLCREGGQTPTEVFETIAKLNGVLRYVNLVTSGPARLSAPRLEQSAAALLAAVSGELVVLDGVKSKVEVETPTEAALQEQLTAYGAVATGEGKFGFGYRISDRVKMEWLMIPVASITTLVEQSPALTNIELRKYWMEHQLEFPVTALSSTADAASFDGSRDAVKAKVLTATLAEKSKEISKFMADRMQLSMRGMPQVNGYYTLPADWVAKEFPLAQLATEVAEKFAIAAPTVQTSGESWTSPKEVAAIPGLGTATTNRFGAQPVNAGQLVEALREFNAKTTLIAQSGVTSPVLQNAVGDLFVFRVTAVEASHAPAAIDIVRDALIADVNRLHRYEKLVGMTSEIQREALDQGLGAVATTYGTSVEQYRDLRQGEKQFLQYGMKFPGQLPILGSDAAVVKAVVEKAMSLPTGGTQITDMPLSERTLVIPAPEKLSMVVVRIDSITQMNRGEIPALVTNQRFRSVVASDQAMGSPQDLFTLEALIARNGFTLANPAKAKDGDDADGADGKKDAPVAPAKAGQ